MRLPWSDAGEAKPETIVNEGAEFRGTVSVKGPILIHGRLEGDARCEDRIIVGRMGHVRGDLAGRVVTIAGRVHGKVEATELVELRETAQLTGEIHAPKLMVVEGAVYDGTVHMGAPAPAPAPRPAPAPAPRPSSSSSRRLDRQPPASPPPLQA